MTSPTVLGGDVGATKTRLGLFELDGLRPIQTRTFSSAAHESLGEIVTAFLEGRSETPHAACLGVAGPVLGPRVEGPNLPWAIERDRLEPILGCETIELVNDVVATAEGVALLADDRFTTLQAGIPDPHGTRIVLAMGTGLGAAILVETNRGSIALPTEAGHVDFAPKSRDEVELYELFAARYDHVSYERIVSGGGLVRVYDALREKTGGEHADFLDRPDRAAAIADAAIEGSSPLAAQALALVIRLLGALAGNLALATFATGGVLIAGGIPPKLFPHLDPEPFLEAFRAKGRFRNLLERIPLRLVLEADTALLGAARRAARAC